LRNLEQHQQGIFDRGRDRFNQLHFFPGVECGTASVLGDADGLMGAGGNPLHNIDLVADPPQPVQMDGELAGKTPVNIKWCLDWYASWPRPERK